MSTRRVDQLRKNEGTARRDRDGFSCGENNNNNNKNAKTCPDHKRQGDVRGRMGDEDRE